MKRFSISIYYRDSHIPSSHVECDASDISDLLSSLSSDPAVFYQPENEAGCAFKAGDSSHVRR